MTQPNSGSVDLIRMYGKSIVYRMDGDNRVKGTQVRGNAVLAIFYLRVRASFVGRLMALW